jgi:hypothetical protein
MPRHPWRGAKNSNLPIGGIVMKTTKNGLSKVFMVGIAVMALAFGLVGLLASCASSGPTYYKTMSPDEKAQADILGTIAVSFTTTVSNEINLQYQALAELRTEAEKQDFTGDIDIRNIIISKITTGFALSTTPTPTKYSATGDVVKLGAE